MIGRPPESTLFPYTTLFRSVQVRREAERRRDPLVARSDAQGGERCDQRRGAAVDRDGVRDPVGGGEPPFELLDLRALGQAAGAQHLQDQGLLVRADRDDGEGDHPGHACAAGSSTVPPRCPGHRRSAGRSAARLTTSPHAQTHPWWRAGLPATSWCGATSRVTTEPAATIAARPSTVPHTMVALAPIEAPSWTAVGVTVHSATEARGRRSLVNTALGPTKTSDPSTTPVYTETLFWILQRSPMTAPASTKTFLPSTHPDPITAPARTCAWCQTRVSAPICAPCSMTAVSWAAAGCRVGPCAEVMVVRSRRVGPSRWWSRPAGSVPPSEPGRGADGWSGGAYRRRTRPGPAWAGPLRTSAQ